MKFFTNMKKIKLVPLMLSALLLTSCSKSGGTDISQAEQLDLSYMITTDLPCVNGSDIYNIEEYDIDLDSLGINEAPTAFDGENVYFFYTNGQNSDYSSFRSALILSYELKTGQVKEIYREEPYSDNVSIPVCYYMGITDGVMYWFSADEYNDAIGYRHTCNARLLGYDLKNGTVEETAKLNTENLLFSEFTARVEDKLYFEVKKHNDYFEHIKSAVWCYDITQKKLTEIIDYAENPISYKNGFVYTHDNAVYYHGSDKIPNLGEFYENDGMIYEPYKNDGGRELKLFSGGDTLMYSYFRFDSRILEYNANATSYVNASSCTVGELDGKFRERDIAAAASYSRESGFMAEGECTEGLVCFAELPFRSDALIYDKAGGFFASLTLDFPDVYFSDPMLDYDTAPVVCALSGGDSFLLYAVSDFIGFGGPYQLSEKMFVVRNNDPQSVNT